MMAVSTVSTDHCDFVDTLQSRCGRTRERNETDATQFEARPH
jgi:hypothetical protein